MNEPTSSRSEHHSETFERCEPRYADAVVEYFHQHANEVATVENLGTFVARREHVDVDESQVAIHLHHSTLPKLADRGVLDYDPRTNTVRYREQRTANR